MNDDETLDELIRVLWLTGDIKGQLLPHQYSLYSQFTESDFKKTVWLCSRRFGKSFLLVLLAIEACLKKEGVKVRYGASTQKMVEEFIVPIIYSICETAPEHLKPIWKKSEGRLYFPSRPNSNVVISGLDDNRADRLRGPSMDLGIIDEAQNVDDLDYVVKSVLNPQTVTTGGRIIIAGTVPQSVYHPFIDYISEADRDHALIKRTIYQDSRQDVLDQIPELMKEAGGSESSTWLREYMMVIVTDEESAIVPEFSRPEVRESVVKELERAPHFIAYTVIDLGLIDYTAVVFGYVDFIRGKKVILDEFLVNRKDSKYIADAIIAKEKQIWGTDERGGCLHEPRRYCDGPAMTVMDFNSLHKMHCSGVSKDTLEAMVNELRIDCHQGTLQIHPRCVETQKQIQYGIWDKQHKGFARSSAYGHFDLLAATMYFIRHVNMRENPYPKEWGLSQGTHIIQDYVEPSYTKKSIKDAFKL